MGFNDLWLSYADLCKNPVDGFSAGLLDDTNLFEWSVTIIGPPDTLLLVFLSCYLLWSWEFCA